SWPCQLRRQNDIFLASTKGCQSDFSVIPMGAPISRGRSAHSAIPTSTPTTGVTTPLDTGITILLTTGNGDTASWVPPVHRARHSRSRQRPPSVRVRYPLLLPERELVATIGRPNGKLPSCLSSSP